MNTGEKLLAFGALSSMAGFLPFFYLLCNSGGKVTAAFVDLNESIYRMSWYLYPMECQTNVLVMVMMANKPVYLGGFSSLKCSRETFKQVDSKYDSPIDNEESTSNFHFLFRF